MMAPLLLDLQHTAPACKCGKPAKYVALVHHVDRCNRIDTFSLRPDGNRIELVCVGCMGALADRTKYHLAMRRHPASGSKRSCGTCDRPLVYMHDWLDVSSL
jgi:hypothetical protein